MDPKAQELYVADGYGNRRVIALRCEERGIQAPTGARTAPAER